MVEKLAPEKRHVFLHNGQKVFEWDQTLDEVDIYINLPPNVHSKLFYCKIQSKHIELGIKGNPPFLNHDLTSPVKTDSSFWTLEDDVMHITLNKRDKGQTWASPILGQGKDVNVLEKPLSDLSSIEQLKKENCELKERLKKVEEISGEASQALQEEKDMRKSLEAQLRDAEQKIDDMNKEQETLIDVFAEERDMRNAEEKNLRKKLQEASNTIQELLEKVRLLERKSSSGKVV